MMLLLVLLFAFLASVGVQGFSSIACSPTGSMMVHRNRRRSNRCRSSDADHRFCLAATTTASGDDNEATSEVSNVKRSKKSSETATATTTTMLVSPEKLAERLENVDWQALGTTLLQELQEIAATASLALSPLLQPDNSVTAAAIVSVCDQLDELDNNNTENNNNSNWSLRRSALQFQRYELLAKLMRHDYDAYVATASFLSPSRIPRLDLPNVQDVPYNSNNYNIEEKEAATSTTAAATTRTTTILDENGQQLVADCELDDMEYNDSLLDKALLSIFRKLVTKNTGGVTSEKEGILGLLEQGRTFMLQPNQTAEAQHQMVYDTLGGLMTPVLPPFYRIFMSGIIPKQFGSDWGGGNKQLGPWFYAPLLTSIVTPTFFGFLVGPSRPNRRKDGRLGGLVVEKCKFLQQSGCKGLCLHQCKLPAQQFFAEELGLPLNVQPNFVTQECQWSFGEMPIEPVSDDPSFPKGCLAGCQSRQAIAAASAGSGANANLCN